MKSDGIKILKYYQNDTQLVMLTFPFIGIKPLIDDRFHYSNQNLSVKSSHCTKYLLYYLLSCENIVQILTLCMDKRQQNQLGELLQ